MLSLALPSYSSYATQDEGQLYYSNSAQTAYTKLLSFHWLPHYHCKASF